MSAEPALPPSSERARWPWRRLVVFLGLMLGVIGLLLVMIFRDEPPPDLSDLQPAPRTLPAAENAYLAFRALAAEVMRSGGEPLKEAVRQIGNGDEPPSAEQSALILATAEACWPPIVTITAMPRSEAPLVTNVDEFISDLGPMRSLQKIALHRIRTRASAAPDQALADTLTAFQLGTVVGRAGGTLIENLTAQALRGVAVEALRDVVTAHPPSVEAGRAALVQLAAARLPTAVVAETWRSEVWFFAAMLADPAQERPLVLSLSGWPEWSAPVARTFYQPNQTLRLHAERMRSMIAHLEATPAEAIAAWPELPSPYWFGRLPSPANGIGRLLLMDRSVYESMAHGRATEQTTVSLHLAWLALQLHEREHGHLPATLAALVPAYLPEVPRDYFTTEAVGYDPELRAVWSVGRTGTYRPDPTASPPPYGRVLDLRIPPWPRVPPAAAASDATPAPVPPGDESPGL